MSDGVDFHPTSPIVSDRSRDDYARAAGHAKQDVSQVGIDGFPATAAHSDESGKRRLHHFFEASCDATPHSVALECGDESITYRELDSQANRLAHYLLDRGLRAGFRAGILLTRSVDLYVALLAVQKTGATFVPIDPASPADRVAYVASDANLAVIVSSTELTEACADAVCPVLAVDTIDSALNRAPAHRPAIDSADDPSCYVIYTSGSTGRPKGVEVAQSSICNFIDVVPQVYDVQRSDRVYQGMTIAFDFSIEEIWPTWAVGATLVAGPTDSRRIGSGLAQFLATRAITVLYCVPTVLATIDHELPLLRSLLVGGEACPAELVARWSKPNRRMLNTYGPTEATVTATWGELRPGRPVTIGRALPTYRITLLDEQRRPVPDGDVGEICIGGIGVARGYLNRAELTADRFIDDPADPGHRIYRTGDLGRLTADGEIEYLGRADSEVKVRGHRVDLGEIESVIMQDPAVAVAAVTLYQAPGGNAELAAYLTGPEPGDDATALRGRLAETLYRRLPHYMVPAFLEILPALPLMPSGKVDRKSLPAPQGRRLVRQDGERVAATTELEAALAGVWAGIVGVEPDELSVTADFFHDLGGHSLLAAQTASALRHTDFGADLSVADLYAYPTVRALAAHLAAGTTQTIEATAADRRRPAPLRHKGSRVVGSGIAQLLIAYVVLFSFSAPATYALGVGGGRLSGSLLWELLVIIPATLITARVVLPVVGARLLSIGLRAGRYPLWGLTFLRVWTIQTLMSFAPLTMLSGSPLLAPYLRLLGARVGKRCHLATGTLPLPTMVYLGDDVCIGYGAQLQSSYVEHGRLTIKPVTVRSNAFIGSNAMVQAGAELGHGAVLTEMSLAAEDQIIPAGEYWTGSPAAPAAERDPLLAELAARPRPADWSGAQRAGFLAGWLGLELLVYLLLAPSMLLTGWAMITGGTLAGLASAALTGPLFVVATCLVVAVGRRLVLPRTPTGIHPLASSLGLRKWLADKLLQTSLATTNSMYATLYTVPWLRLLGARVGPRSEVSTAAHLDPDLLSLGTESFIADMASVGSATYRNGYVALGRTTVGDRSFVGNAALLRSGTEVGAGSLVGVHTMAPVDGVASGSDWLGSPAIRLPRRQESASFDDALTFRPSRLRVAERLVIEFFRIVLPASILAVVGYLGMLFAATVAQQFGTLGVVLLGPVMAMLTGLAVVLTVAGLKWLVVGRYRPRVEPLWSRFVRRSEFITALYETAAVPALLGGLAGTPMLGALLRLFGVRVGRRTWIATTYLTEFDLVHIGDDVSVGAATSLQTHLFEDRVMKMSTIDLERGVSIGGRTVVLYDTTVGAGTAVDALSLVMKGEALPGATRWRGIPSRAVR